ncbi:kinase-like domain-containing protein [Aspergillus flavus]|uniref:Kinase-like domain-containing protein n=2 Tax=Aspergillus subgen. Circumdati TaxID=2720871 RepID=A0A5N6GVM7_ASPFL|nr:checkpoint kinase [Aspergillus oryzae 3.042]KAB8244503.1 kinase-like domain-containing protein [Aspergillus flavus]KDE78364.1 checkpoint kinase [Aspergillus oryzae 100-8]|eukprot:EIT73845.1 checkpoint kinase [Aspergillus oryzae 3.042]
MSQLQNSYGTCTTHRHQLKLKFPEHKSSLKLLSALTFPNVLARCWLPRESTDDEERQTLLTPSSTAPSTLTERYGLSTIILHYGVHSSVRVCTRKSPSAGASRQLHVVKILRRSSDALVRATQRFEQSLSSAVSHPNLLQTIDVLQNEHGETCLVMDYCAGGNLNALIATAEDSIDALQADCFFKQIMRAVTYLHDNAIAHRGLKTENILLTAHGAVKVADFGSAEWLLDEVADGEHAENRIRLQLSSLYSPRKLRGSIPYLPPEEFSNYATVDPRAGDVWAAGLVYMAMRCGRLLWRMPCADEDGGYSAYLRGRQTYDGYPPIEALEETRCRNVIYAMLHPDPVRRIKASEVLRSEWVYYVQVCDAGEIGW